MDLRARIFVVILSLSILTFVITLVRRKNLKENYAILWVITCIVLSAVPLLIDYLDRAAYAVGIDYPPAFLYLIAIIFIFILILHFSVIVSKLSEQNKSLIQDFGIMEKKVADLETEVKNASKRASKSTVKVKNANNITNSRRGAQEIQG